MRKPKDWGQPCPNPDCSHYRLINRGNMSAISTYLTQSGRRRIFRCSACEQPFSETRDTVFFNLRSPEEKVMMALKMLLVKVALSDIGFVLGVAEATVLEWLRRAAQQAEQINAHLLRDLPVTQVQLDEMWNFIRRKHAQHAGPDGESSELRADGRQWVWLSFAREYRLILAAFVGPRTFASALQLIQLTATVVWGVPCFFSDGFSCYLSALIEVYHTLKTFPRTGKPGRPKQPVKEPHPRFGLWTSDQKEAPRASARVGVPRALWLQAVGDPGAVDQHEFDRAAEPHAASCPGSFGPQKLELL